MNTQNTQSARRTPRESSVAFHNLPWGTSMQAFKARWGNPVHTDTFDGYQMLIYENMIFAGFRAFMVVYFSDNGLEGGAYYFNTNNMEELMSCYAAAQRELVAMYGHPPAPPGGIYEELLRELRLYETAWNLPTGYVYLKINTRGTDPVTLWISSPGLTQRLRS